MSIGRRTRAAAAAAALTAVLAVPAAPASADDHDGFVLRRDGSKAVPFVPAPDPGPVARGDDFDWGDAGIGAGAGVVALLLASAGAHVIRDRRGHGRSPRSIPAS